jgi:1,4-dihydroxy-2-naphthoate octaprenyltransferase
MARRTRKKRGTKKDAKRAERKTAAAKRDDTGATGGRRAAPRNSLLLLLAAIRAPFLTASALPVLVGSTLPFWLRPPGFTFNWGLALEALVAVVLIHVGSNMANEYFDTASGADARNPHRGGLSGGSGLIPDGILPAAFFLRGSVACLVAGAVLGLHLNAVLPGNFILVLGLVGILGGVLYTAPPVKFSYRGLGEVVLFFCFGVLPVVGSYYVQTQIVSWYVVAASLPLAFAVLLILWVNEVVDREFDEAAGKRTLVVVLGPRRAGRAGVLTLCLLIFVSLFAAAFTASLIPLSLVAVLAFGLVRTIVVDCWKYHDRPAELSEAQVSAVRLHMILGLVLFGSALAAAGS